MGKESVFAKRPAGECPACGALMLADKNGVTCGWCKRPYKDALAQRERQGGVTVRWP